MAQVCGNGTFVQWENHLKKTWIQVSNSLEFSSLPNVPLRVDHALPFIAKTLDWTVLGLINPDDVVYSKQWVVIRPHPPPQLLAARCFGWRFQHDSTKPPLSTQSNSGGTGRNWVCIPDRHSSQPSRAFTVVLFGGLVEPRPLSRKGPHRSHRFTALNVVLPESVACQLKKTKKKHIRKNSQTNQWFRKNPFTPQIIDLNI